MRRRPLSAAVLVTAAVALAFTAFGLAAGSSKTIKLKAQLNAGQEVPHQAVSAPQGTGRWTATLTGMTLHWKLTFAHLSGPATAAHVHMGVRGKSGNILIPLCMPCHTGITGTKTITAAEKTLMLSRKTYVNIHTAKNPNGEIRGQITRAR
jgi:CHRD domain